MPGELTRAQVIGVLHFAEGWLWGIGLEHASHAVRHDIDEMADEYMDTCNVPSSAEQMLRASGEIDIERTAQIIADVMQESAERAVLTSGDCTGFGYGS